MKKNSLLLFLLSVCSAFTLFACGACSKKDSETSSSGDSSTIGSIGDMEQDPFLSLSKTELNDFVVGDSQIIFADFAELDGVSLTWENSNDNVVALESLNKYSCKVTAMRVGETTVTATYGELQKTCTIKVTLNNLYPSLEFAIDRTGVVNIFPNSKLDLSGYVAFNGKKFDDAKITYSVADPTFGSVDAEKQVFTSLNKLGSTTITVRADWRGVQSELLEKTVTVKVVAPKTVILKDSDGKSIQQMQLYTVDSFEGTTYQNAQTISSIVVQEANADVQDYTIAITDSVAGDGSDTPVAIWDSTNKRVIANTYGSAKLTVSFASPANGEPFSYSFAITVVRPVAEYEDSIQNFSWLIGDLPVETIFKIGSKEIVNAEQDGRALTITDNKLTDVATTSHTQMSRETVTVYNDKVGYVLQLETYAMVIDSADEFQAYLDSGETRVITGYFELKKDIHIQTPWQYRAEKMTFSGVLEGNGYTLTVPMRSYGLFGSLKGTLQNLHIHVTDVTTKGSYKSTSIIAQDSNTKALVKNMYVTIELAKNANFPYAVSLFGSSDNTFQLKNFVADLGDQLPADGYGYNMYGVLFQYISYISTQGIKEENFANVYIISSGLKILVSRHDKALGDANNSNIYAGNDTDLYDAYTPAEGENKYKIAAINRYNTYADFVGADHTYTEFDTKYWEVIDGGLYWKGVYADGVEVVATDKAGEAISEYQLQATTDTINLSMVDMYGNSLGSIDYTIVNNDGNLKNENGTFSLTNAVLEDKTYTITLKAVVDGITIERNITIQAVAIRTTYTQEVYLATNSDYNGTDEYVLTNAGLTTLPTGITSASLNGVALTVADGQLPDVTMHYVKKFEEYGKTRETYMDILVGATSIVSKKAEQAPLTLVVKTATETIEFTNLFVCTDVIQVASDLERFEVRDLANAETQNNDGYYVMTNNIDASALNFAHQRDIYNPSHRFVGAFDGRGYTISNLDVGGVYTGGSNPVKPCGLFGNLYGADILNVGFVNVSAEGGSVLGSHNSNIGTGFCTTAGSLQYSESIYPAKMSNGYAYASTRIENVYIQVADSVTSLKGALSPTMNDYNFLQNVVVEWNPTNAAALSAGYGSLVGVGTTWNDANKPKRENIVVLSSVQLNNDMATCSGVAAYANRATMESQNTASLEGFVTYWTTTSNSPVWKTANWQQNN